jgi:dUTP pyrophosphatase
VIQYYLKNADFNLVRGSDGAAGWDVRADISTPRTLEPGQRWRVSTGLYLAMPKGVVAMLCSRSGLAAHHAICVINSPGVVDSDYRGEVVVNIINNDRQDHQPYTINPGDRIAQILFMTVFPDMADLGLRFGQDGYNPEFWLPSRVAQLEHLGDTSRGVNGHGSTGR